MSVAALSWCLSPTVMRETMRAPTRNGREAANARVASAEPFHPTATASPTLVGGVEGANSTAAEAEARAASLPAAVAVRAALPSASSRLVPPSRLPKLAGSAAARQARRTARADSDVSPRRGILCRNAVAHERWPLSGDRADAAATPPTNAGSAQCANGGVNASESGANNLRGRALDR